MDATPVIIVFTVLKERQIERQASIAPVGCGLWPMLALPAAEKVEDVVEHRELLAARPGHKKALAASE